MPALGARSGPAGHARGLRRLPRKRPRARPLARGGATHALPAEAGDAWHVVETEIGPALYWRVGDDHFVSQADPATGQWGPDRLVATDAAAFNRVIPVCDGVLIDLVEPYVPESNIHLHLARPGVETVSRIVGVDPDNIGYTHHWPTLAATGLELDVQLRFDGCEIYVDAEPLDAQTLASLGPPRSQLRAEPSITRVQETLRSGALFDYAFRGLGRALLVERRQGGSTTASHEVPLPDGGVGAGGRFETALGPTGEVFVYVAGSPDAGHGRLLQLNTNGRRVVPDRVMPVLQNQDISLVSWPGGVALAVRDPAALRLLSPEDPALVADLDARCTTDAPGRCGVGAFEADGAGWRCVTPAPADEICNAVDDDCDGLTDEAPAACDFHFTGPAVAPRPPMSCALPLIPWPELLGASDPNPDPCQAFANERPCRVGDASFRYDASGNLTRAAGRAYRWEDGRLMGWAGARLEYDAAGRLVTDDRGAQGLSRFTYDAAGRLLAWTQGDGTIEYEWAADGGSVVLRHLSFWAARDFDVRATLVGGIVADVGAGEPYEGSVEPPGDPRCGTLVTFAADDGAYAAGDEMRESWGRRVVLDSAGRLHAASGGGGYRRDASNPSGNSSAEVTTLHFDALGRLSERITCQSADYIGSCLEYGDDPPGPTCAVEAIAYDCR